MRLFRSPAVLVLLSVSAVTASVACGTSSDETAAEAPPNNPSENGSSGGGDGFGSSGGSGDAASPECAATSATTEKGKVDIVFVIDDSQSMGEEIAQIKANVNSFAAKIGAIGLDYTVTFIVKRASTPTETGCIPVPGKSWCAHRICVPAPLAGANCADRPPQFHHVDQDVRSDDSLSLILSTYETSWKNYLRMDATKVFIEVTDDESKLSWSKFDEQLLAKAPAGMFGTADKRKYIFHSIISKPFADAVPSNRKCAGADGTSVNYQHLSQLTGGIIDEICKADYSAVLDNMAKGIVSKLGCDVAYPSSAESDPTKVAVTFAADGRATQTLTQVTDASKCGAIPDAWYYDDPAKPTKIILCPSTCAVTSAATGAKLEALVGCKTAPPK